MGDEDRSEATERFRVATMGISPGEPDDSAGPRPRLATYSPVDSDGRTARACRGVDRGTGTSAPCSAMACQVRRRGARIFQVKEGRC